nr:hypothetical protein [Nonomuraea sp. SYSU D8015]
MLIVNCHLATISNIDALAAKGSAHSVGLDTEAECDLPHVEALLVEPNGLNIVNLIDAHASTVIATTDKAVAVDGLSITQPHSGRLDAHVRHSVYRNGPSITAPDVASSANRAS